MCRVVMWCDGMIWYHEAVGQSHTSIGRVDASTLKHTRTDISEWSGGGRWEGDNGAEVRNALGVGLVEYLMLFSNDDSFGKFAKARPTFRVNNASLRNDKLACMSTQKKMNCVTDLCVVKNEGKVGKSDWIDSPQRQQKSLHQPNR